MDVLINLVEGGECFSIQDYKKWSKGACYKCMSIQDYMDVLVNGKMS